jgi:hypothetical protein
MLGHRAFLAMTMAVIASPAGHGDPVAHVDAFRSQRDCFVTAFLTTTTGVIASPAGRGDLVAHARCFSFATGLLRHTFLAMTTGSSQARQGVAISAVQEIIT